MSSITSFYFENLRIPSNILDVSNNQIIINKLECSNLNITGNIILNDINISGNNILIESKTFNTFNLTVGNSLYGNSIISNYLSNLSNMSVSAMSYINYITVGSNLTILKSLTGNTIQSTDLNVSGISIIGFITNFNNLVVSTAILNNNVTINSSMNINNNLRTINLTVLNNLCVSQTSSIGLNFTNLSILYNTGATIISNSIITNNLNINNSIFVANSTLSTQRMTIINNLFATQYSFINNLTSSSTIILNIPDYPDNITAANNGIPLWGYYRTGGILKIRTNIISPSISLLGSQTLSLLQGMNYTEPGVIASDYFNNSLTPTVSAIYYSSYNYLNNTNFSNLITSFNNLLVGNHTITYNATDSYNNITSINRFISVYANLSKPSIVLSGPSSLIVNVGSTYTEFSVSISSILNDNIILQMGGTVNTQIIGQYLLSYTATNKFNQSSSVQRTVYVLLSTSLIGYSMYSSNLTYLYISRNYSSLAMSQFWTFESWVYLNSLTNGATLIDFAPLPFTDSNGTFSILINSSGYAGFYLGTENQYVYLTSNPITIINSWFHFVCQRNGIYIEFYINGTFIGKLLSNKSFDSSNLTNLNQITLGQSNNISLTSSVNHLNGSLSHTKLSIGLIYPTAFFPQNDLSPNNMKNILFFLYSNLLDLVSNQTMSYSYLPDSFPRLGVNLLPSINIEQRDLIFNFNVTNMPITNTSWNSTNNLYQFVINNTSNNFSSLLKVQNNNGWGRTANVGWNLNPTSHSLMSSLNWNNGLTLEFWLFIDSEFFPHPATTNMLLCGQSSLFDNLGYGFVSTATSYYPYISYPDHYISFATNVPLTNQGPGYGPIPITPLKGKWTHLVATVGTSSQLNPSLIIYINGGVHISLNSTQWTNWPNPANTTQRFSYGCDFSSGSIQSMSLKNMYFGNIRLYNRILSQTEILNNYFLELPLYKTPTSDIYLPPVINTSPLTSFASYDLYSNYGWISENMDTLLMRTLSSWCIEGWAYITSWGSTGDAAIVELSNYPSDTVMRVGLTSSVDSITPTITNPNNLIRPYMYYSDDTIIKKKVNNAQTATMNKWIHVVYQKNSDNELEMFLNGKSTGIFTVASADWKFPNFMSGGMNTIFLGGDSFEFGGGRTSSKFYGKLSQIKINLYRKYLSEFIPSDDLSLNDNQLFMLNEVGVNSYNNKILRLVSSRTEPVGQAVLSYNGPTKVYYNIPWTNPGVILQYYLRASYTINFSGTVNSQLPGIYTLTYSYTDMQNNITYLSQNITVAVNLIPPTIQLIGDSLTYLPVNTPFVDPGVKVTSVTGENIVPVVTGNIDITTNGTYTITYTATDSSSNVTTVTRTVVILSTKTAYMFSPAITFDNSRRIFTDGRYFEYPGNVYNFFNSNTNWTIEFWLYIKKPTTGNVANYYPLFSILKPNLVDFPDCYMTAWLEPNDGFYQITIFTAKTTVQSGATRNKLDFSKWYHIALTYDGTRMNIFCNGYITGFDINSALVPGSLISTSIFRIGYSYMRLMAGPLTNQLSGRLPGYISQFTILNYIKYIKTFTPNLNLLPSDMTKCFIYLDDNYTDAKSNILFTIYDNSNMALNIATKPFRLSPSPYLVYSFPGGALSDGQYWALHNNTIGGVAWDFDTVVDPINTSSIDFSQGITITWDYAYYGGTAHGPAGLVYIGNNPSSIATSTYTSSNLSNVWRVDNVNSNYISYVWDDNQFQFLSVTYDKYHLLTSNGRTNIRFVQYVGGSMGLSVGPSNVLNIFSSKQNYSSFPMTYKASPVYDKSIISGNGIWFSTVANNTPRGQCTNIRIYNKEMTQSELENGFTD